MAGNLLFFYQIVFHVFVSEARYLQKGKKQPEVV